MKKLTLGVCLTLGGLIGATTAGMAADKMIEGNLRVVIGSNATSGDTYQVSAIVTEALGKKLGVDAKVDAVGPSAAFKALARVTDGTTIMIFHDQSYLGYLYGIKGYDDIFADYMVGPTLAINPGNGYLVPKKSPYKTLEDAIVAAGKGTKVRVAIQPGGVSEIGFSALKNAVKQRFPGQEGNMVAVNTGSQADKDQLLFDGQADIINGSVQANEQYTRLPAEDQKAMSFVWLTASHKAIAEARAEGFGKTSRDELLKFVEPNVNVTQDGKKNFVFDKDFFIIYNKNMKPELVAYFDKALQEIYAEGKIVEAEKAAFFTPNFLPTAKAQAYLKSKMNDYGTIIKAIRQ
jgi:tripartite-type tricarboxylate transporter receptor subunit TctC